jgi:hypothetical protein
MYGDIPIKGCLIGRVGYYPHGKDKCSDELHSQENEGCIRRAKRAYEILTS